jgi:nucleotide-binding universal stress UspA family protein
MYKKILVPVDLADTDLAKPALTTAVAMARASGG